ncbi:DODA-type extradiol aromatic ring-opening family dioxygenase [Arcobacter sp.]|uniref:DODA-type extradiol aromatic ring-opening family dioxygenase n=1 Tax=Arcobacter sp. TaxID=1872629 RepID=UPI003D111A1D
MLPSIYISHGSPSLALMENSTTNFLKNLPKSFETPKYILVISAHWVTNNLKILYEDKPSTIHDFYNFPRELYELTYEAPSSKEKNDEVIELLQSNKIEIQKEYSRGGYDHGVWSPLSFLYPKADIPIIQISLPISYDVKELIYLGEVLSPLRDDTLIVASGSITHNLRDMIWDENSTKIKPYAKIFKDWVVEKIENADVDSLINYKKEAPYLSLNHPSLEHFLPLFVSLGASKNKVGKSLHDVYMYGNLSMDTILFKE